MQFLDEFRCIDHGPTQRPTERTGRSPGRRSVGRVRSATNWVPDGPPRYAEQFLYMRATHRAAPCLRRTHAAGTPALRPWPVRAVPGGDGRIDRDVLGINSGPIAWAPELRAQRPRSPSSAIACAPQPVACAADFVYSAATSRDRAPRRSWSCPMTPAHPYQTSMDVVALAPHAEVTLVPLGRPTRNASPTIQQVRDARPRTHVRDLGVLGVSGGVTEARRSNGAGAQLLDC